MKTKPYFYIILCIGLLLGACQKLPSTRSENYDFSKDYIAAAISTNNLPLTQNYVLKYGNKEEYIKMALEANSLDVLAFLLQTSFVTKNFSDSPYFYARSKEAFRLLEKAGYSPNASNYEGRSVAEYYFEETSLDFFKYFLQASKGLDLSSEKKLPFYVIEREDRELVSLMLQRGANFTLRDSEGNYPIYYANDEDVISLLLTLPYNVEQKNERKEQILGEVYLRLKREGKTKLAQKCIEIGVNPNYHSYQDRQ